MTRAARGRIDGHYVVVDDPAQANRLYNKGFVGTPEPGNRLRLRPSEAAWAIAQGRLEVPDAGMETVLALGDDRAAMEVETLAVTDLRERGLVARPEHAGGPGALAVWARGAHPPASAEWHTRAASEREPVQAADLAVRAASGECASVVDEDGAVTHYRLHRAEPAGAMPLGRLAGAAGHLLTDRVLVPEDPARAWMEAEGLGTPAPGGVMLSLVEAAHLQRRGVLRLGADAQARGVSRQPRFEASFAVFEDLRRRGVVARSGFRFGTHLRGYTARPDEEHAQWLVHAARPDEPLHWSDVSRGVRLAHGVRKAFLVAVAESPVAYVQVDWLRP